LVNTLEGEGAHMWVLREADAPVGMVGLLGDVAVPGLSWLLCRQAWGRGLMAEAASAVVEYAFGSLGLDRVEAWVEATTVRSLSTARRIGLVEYGRLAHRTRPHETIVLGRPREPEPTTVLGVEGTLRVLDIASQLDVLRPVLGTRQLYAAGDPPAMVGLVFGPWSVGPCLRLVAAASPPEPVTVSVDVGTEFDASYRRADAVGADIAEPPVEQPWGIREFVLRLPHGHRLVVTGPA
jgi:hypothetical protein